MRSFTNRAACGRQNSTVKAGFGEDNYNRLAAIKAEFDPDNVFHLDHNVNPA